MEQQRYSGLYANKAHTTSPLGQAVFWKQSRYELVDSTEADLTCPLTLNVGCGRFITLLALLSPSGLHDRASLPHSLCH